MVKKTFVNRVHARRAVCYITGQIMAPTPLGPMWAGNMGIVTPRGIIAAPGWTVRILMGDGSLKTTIDPATKRVVQLHSYQEADAVAKHRADQAGVFWMAWNAATGPYESIMKARAFLEQGLALNAFPHLVAATGQEELRQEMLPPEIQQFWRNK